MEKDRSAYWFMATFRKNAVHEQAYTLFFVTIYEGMFKSLMLHSLMSYGLALPHFRAIAIFALAAQPQEW